MMKIEFQIDPANPGHVNAVNAFFNAFNGGVQEQRPVKTEAEPLKKRVVKTEAPKEEPSADLKAATAPPPTAETQELTVEGVRTVVAEKVAANIENREKIKNKLVELGAASVTTLDAAKYEPFMQFLTKL